MSQSTAVLKLVKEERRDDDPIPLERRVAHRKPISTRVTALQTIEPDDESDAPRNRICSLQLHDISDTGLGATADEPVPAGAKVTVFFPPHGPDRGFDLYGQVVWSRQVEDRHELGIRLNRQQTACA